MLHSFSNIFVFCFTAIAYVLIGSGLYDEAIRHFSTMLQVIFPLTPVISGVQS